MEVVAFVDYYNQVLVLEDSHQQDLDNHHNHLMMHHLILVRETNLDYLTILVMKLLFKHNIILFFIELFHQNSYLVMVPMQLLVSFSLNPPQLAVLLVADQCHHDQNDIQMQVNFLYSVFLVYMQHYCLHQFLVNQQCLSMFYFWQPE